MLQLPRKISDEDEEDMTECPVQLFSYDPSKPITNNKDDHVNHVLERPGILVKASTAPAEPEHEQQQPEAETGGQEPMSQDQVHDEEKSKKHDQACEATPSETPVSSQVSLRQAESDESGWETLHSMIGLPPLSEPSLTPITTNNMKSGPRRSGHSVQEVSSKQQTIQEDNSPEPEMTRCLGGLMMQRSKSQISQVDSCLDFGDVTTFSPYEESTRALNKLPAMLPRISTRKVDAVTPAAEPASPHISPIRVTKNDVAPPTLSTHAQSSIREVTPSSSSVRTSLINSEMAEVSRPGARHQLEDHQDSCSNKRVGEVTAEEDSKTESPPKKLRLDHQSQETPPHSPSTLSHDVEGSTKSPEAENGIVHKMKECHMETVSQPTEDQIMIEIDEVNARDNVKMVTDDNNKEIIDKEPGVLKLEEVTIFTDLVKKQTSDAKHDWELLRHNDKFAAFGFIEQSLLLMITLGEKLEPKKRKSLGRIVHHWTISDMNLVSVHNPADSSLKDQDDHILDAAHYCVTRKLSTMDLKAECPNTYSLSSLLKKVSSCMAPAITFIRSLQYVSSLFYPFKLENNVVTFGEC